MIVRITAVPFYDPRTQSCARVWFIMMRVRRPQQPGLRRPGATVRRSLPMSQDNATIDERAVISGLVPMLHVEDMERSIAFYRLLGFEVGNYVPRDGPKHWAWLYAPKVADWRRGPNLMLARSDCAIDAHAQEVVFYFYAADLASLHRALVSKGVGVGPIEYPEYLPAGEFRVRDPDGYTVMVAQSGADTP
jgi:catechol 2,3-dioxygenase-like lactoylglutathione lyase family enzyme